MEVNYSPRDSVPQVPAVIPGSVALFPPARVTQPVVAINLVRKADALASLMSEEPATDTATGESSAPIWLIARLSRTVLSQGVCA